MLQHFSCVLTSGKSSTFFKETCQVSSGAQHLCTLDLICIDRGLLVIWILIDYHQHSWFSWVVDTFLYGGPPSCTITSSLREDLSLTLDRSCLQRLNVCPLPALPVTACITGQGSQLPGWITTQHCTHQLQYPSLEAALGVPAAQYTLTAGCWS